MICFKEKFDSAPPYQKKRYTELMKTVKADLTDDEKRYILWIAGWDEETAATFGSIFKKLQNS
jgi:hypothetical protein